MAGNLLGTPFKDYVDNQVNWRQIVHGKKTRTDKELQYLNTKNAWVKLASGTFFTQERLNIISKNNPLLKGVGEGADLAKKNILFNGTSNLKGKYLHQKQGIKGDNQAYGYGGTYDFGYSPMPGITDVSIKDLNRGSIKKATLNIKAHNRNQFDVIDNLYMRLGYSILLEWGNDKYLSGLDSEGKGIVSPVLNTLTENEFFKIGDKESYRNILPLIEQTRAKYSGNYDGMFGVISNFSWTFEDDGSYNIKLEIISQGDVIESLKANVPPNKNESTSNAGINTTNSYSKLALKNIKNSEVTLEDFYQVLYKGLKNPTGDGYLQEMLAAYRNLFPLDTETPIYKSPPERQTDRSKVGSFGIAEGTTNDFTGKYGVQWGFTVGSNSGFDFPQINYSSYSSDNPDVVKLYPKNAATITNTPRVEIATRYALKNSFQESYIRIFENTFNSTRFVIQDRQGKTVGGLKQVRPYEIIGIDGLPVKDPKGLTRASYQKNGQTGNVGRYGYTSVKDPYNFDDFVSEYVEEKSKELNVSLNQIRRRVMIRNISDEDFYKFFFLNFKNANLAGGNEDENVQDPNQKEIDELNEEEKANLEAQKQIEVKKDENKVRSYFFNIREIWKNENEQLAEPNRKITFQKIKKSVGSIISPTEDEEIKKWNEKVGFPKYQKVDAANKSDFIRINYTDLTKQYYIRLGTFLEYLEKVIIPKVENKNEGDPMLNIDYDEKNNICYAIDNMLSLNPNKTLIRNGAVWNQTDFDPYFPEVSRFISSSPNKKSVYGQIMNIYFNFARLEEIFDEVDKENQISVFSVLQNIATDINSSLGNVNNIEPIINKETNTVTFIDQTPIPNLSNIASSLKGFKFYNKKQTKLEIFGYSGNKSTFVRKTGISTQITKEYATIISIGATANGAIPGAESTAFSEWNVGIKDRFKNNIFDGQAKRNESLEEQNAKVIEDYKSLCVRQVGKLGLSQFSKTLDSLSINSDLIELNKNVVSNFYIYAQAQNSKNPSQPVESSIGFLPISLKLEMDGISGLQIYNRLTVNSSFLPTTYGETLDFIVTGVNHKLSNNEWVTNLDTIATIKN